MVNIVTGDGSTGAALVEQPGIDKVAFTGSTEVGKAIQRELAGTRQAAHARARRQGGEHRLRRLRARPGGRGDRQRHLLQPGPRLLRRLAAARAGVDPRPARREAEAPHGDAPRRRSARQEHRHRRDQLEGTARPDRRARRRAAPRRARRSTSRRAAARRRAGGSRPTVFTNVAQSHRIAQEEIFGPVLSVLTFRTPDEAVEKANNTMYGLSAGIWTEKGSRILWMADRLRAGRRLGRTRSTASTRRRRSAATRSPASAARAGAHGLEAYLRFRVGGQSAVTGRARSSARRTSSSSAARSRARSPAARSRSRATTSRARRARTRGTRSSRRAEAFAGWARRPPTTAGRCSTDSPR